MNEDLELMSHMLKDVIARVDKLHDDVLIHEQRWQRTFRILQAAVNEAFRQNGEEQT